MEQSIFFSIIILLTAIFLMAAQNISMLKGKWRSCYIALLPVKLLLTYINAYHPGVIPMSGFDSIAYANSGVTLVTRYSDNFLGILQEDNTTFFSQVLGVLYYFIGANPVVGYFFVCFCSLIAFKYMVLMAREMTGNDELAQKCGILFLAWPILLVHASTCLRENQCNLLFILSFYNFVRFVNTHRHFNFVCAVFWAILAAMTHSGMIALLICYCIFGTMVSKSGEIRFSPVKIALGFVLILGLMSSSFSDNMTEKFKGVEDARSLEEITDIVSLEQAQGGATVYITSRPSNPIKLLLLEPYLLLMFVFSPLPYQVHSFGQGISFLVESVPQFLIVCATFKYLFIERKKGTTQIRGYKIMGFWILSLFYFIFSLGTTCYGSAIRHRAKITPLLIVFAVMYYAEKKGAFVGNSKKNQTSWNEVSEINANASHLTSVRSGNVPDNAPRPFMRRPVQRPSQKRRY